MMLRNVRLNTTELLSTNADLKEFNKIYSYLIK